MNIDFIYVAASNSTDEVKQNANFVCEGHHDEPVIQKAVDACIRKNKNLYLFNGIYRIDGFYDFGDDGPHAAICLPNAHRELIFKG